MSQFLTDLWEFSFLQNALLAGIFISIPCGIIGSFVVVRRVTYIAAGIAHCCLGGMGAARYLNIVHGWSWLHPLYGALGAALASALLIGLISLFLKEREDSAISALWAIGMAAGILFIAKTPGYQEDLMSYLFGNILMVSHRDLWLIAGLDAVVLLLTGLFFHQFLAISFDEEFARTRGVRVEAFYLLLLVLTALTVVLLITVVGIVMVIALLTIPVAIANHLAADLRRIMVLAAALCAGLTSTGLACSYRFDLPAGAVTVVLAGVLYLATYAMSSVISSRQKKAAR